MGAFHRDARRGELPFFSFIEPCWTLEEYKFGSLEGFQGNDLHPPGDIRPGLQFFSSIYSSLVSNQKAWANTLLLVTFDEHGGTYDHAIPPDNVTPDEKRDPKKSFLFNRVGPRVPTLLISPMVEAGTVFRSIKRSTTTHSFPYDHTSIPATILKLAGAKPEDYQLFDRVKVAPTFEGVLTRSNNPRTDAELGDNPGEWDEEDPTADTKKPVYFGDVFYLRYTEAGHPCNGKYVTAKSTKDGTNLYFTANRQNAYPFRFTLGYSGKPSIPEKMFVRTTGLIYIQYADPSWPADSKNTAYLRVPDTKTITSNYCVLGKDDQWWYSQWYISNINRETLGRGLIWGDQMTLEYHALNSNKHWLPRKLLPVDSYFEGYYVGVGGDSDFSETHVGVWTIEQF